MCQDKYCYQAECEDYNISDFSIIIIHYRVQPGKLNEVKEKIIGKFEKAHENIFDNDEPNENDESKKNKKYGFVQAPSPDEHLKFISNWGVYDLTLLLKTWLTGHELRLLDELTSIEFTSQTQASICAIPKYDNSNVEYLQKAEDLFKNGFKYPIVSLVRLKLQPFATISFGLPVIQAFLKSLSHLNESFTSINGNNRFQITDKIISICPLHSFGWNEITLVVSAKDFKTSEQLILLLRSMTMNMLFSEDFINKYISNMSWLGKEAKKANFGLNWRKGTHVICKSYTINGLAIGNVGDNNDLISQIDNLLHSIKKETNYKKGENNHGNQSEYIAVEKLIGRTIKRKRNNELKEIIRNYKNIGNNIETHWSLTKTDKWSIKLQFSVKPGHEFKYIETLQNLGILNSHTIESGAGSFDITLYLKKGIFRNPGWLKTPLEYFKVLFLLHFIAGRDYLGTHEKGVNNPEKGGHLIRFSSKIHTGFNPNFSAIRESYPDPHFFVDKILSKSFFGIEKLLKDSDYYSKCDECRNKPECYINKKAESHLTEIAVEILNREKQYSLRTAYQSLKSSFEERLLDPSYFEEYLEFLPAFQDITHFILLNFCPNKSLPEKLNFNKWGEYINAALKGLENAIEDRSFASYTYMEYGDPNHHFKGGINQILSVFQGISNIILKSYKVNELGYADSTIVNVDIPHEIKNDPSFTNVISINSEQLFRTGRVRILWHEISHFINKVIANSYKKEEDNTHFLNTLAEKYKPISEALSMDNFMDFLKNPNNTDIKSMALKLTKDYGYEGDYESLHHILNGIMKEVVAELYLFHRLYPYSSDSNKIYSIELWAKHFWYTRYDYLFLRDNNTTNSESFGIFAQYIFTLCILKGDINKFLLGEININDEEELAFHFFKYLCNNFEYNGSPLMGTMVRPQFKGEVLLISHISNLVCLITMLQQLLNKNELNSFSNCLRETFSTEKSNPEKLQQFEKASSLMEGICSSSFLHQSLLEVKSDYEIEKIVNAMSLSDDYERINVKQLMGNKYDKAIFKHIRYSIEDNHIPEKYIRELHHNSRIMGLIKLWHLCQLNNQSISKLYSSETL